MPALQAGHDLNTGAALAKIREVIRDISKPSWLGHVPNNFGDTSAGTIKADEWRLLITVYIPLALISVWGTSAPGSPTCLALESTMQLVSAVYLACTRITSIRRAHDYRSCIASYVGDLKTCFPKFNLRPNHHVAFHIYNYLILFGPVHSWWTFPFERLIGILQRLPSNHKTGMSL